MFLISSSTHKIQTRDFFKCHIFSQDGSTCVPFPSQVALSHSYWIFCLEDLPTHLPPSFLPVSHIHSLEPIACARPQQCFSFRLLSSETQPLPDCDRHRGARTPLTDSALQKVLLPYPQKELEKNHILKMLRCYLKFSSHIYISSFVNRR